MADSLLNLAMDLKITQFCSKCDFWIIWIERQQFFSLFQQSMFILFRKSNKDWKFFKISYIRHIYPLLQNASYLKSHLKLPLWIYLFLGDWITPSRVSLCWIFFFRFHLVSISYSSVIKIFKVSSSPNELVFFELNIVYKIFLYSKRNYANLRHFSWGEGSWEVTEILIDSCRRFVDWKKKSKF